MTGIDQLRAAHADLRGAFQLLEEELQRFGAEGTADLDVIQETLYYLVHHGELPRYARERLAFQRLGHRHHRLHRLVDATERRQAALQEEAQRLMETVEDMTEDILVPKEEFDHRARSFLRRQRHQLAVQERRLLPLAEQLLTSGDWEAIESDLHRNHSGSAQNRTPLPDPPARTMH